VRVALDTNVLASAIGTRGLCADVLRAVLLEHELVIGESVLLELRRNLAKKFRLAPEVIAEFEALLRTQAQVGFRRRRLPRVRQCRGESTDRGTEEGRGRDGRGIEGRELHDAEVRARAVALGLAGMFIAAVLAAAMTAIAAELNSLSTATVIDFYRRWARPEGTGDHYLMVSKAATGVWGIFACIVATYAASLGSLIEVVNRFGSFFYGSILGVFQLAMMPRARARVRSSG
jgi:hypothetical protein